MTLALDGHISGGAANTNTITLSLTTANADDVVMVGSVTEDPGVTIQSVVATGLTFHRRFNRTLEFGAGAVGAIAETWYAIASAAGTYSITITYNGTFSNCSALAFGVSGANTAAPFDANSSLPALAQSTGGGQGTVTGVSTTAANTFVVCFGFSTDSDSFNVGGGGDPVSPFTWIDGNYEHTGTYYSDIAAEYNVVSSAQSGISIQFGNTNTYWALMADAIVATGESGIAPILSVEGATHATINGASSGTVTINTEGTDRICVLMIEAESNSGSTAPSVTSVTSSHVTWSKAYSTVNTVSNDFSGKIDMEVWTGYASSQLSSEVVTIDFSGSTDAANANFIAVQGATESSGFLDPNVSLPAVNVGNPGSVTFSTSNPDAVLVEWATAGSRDSGGFGTVSSGYTQQFNYDDHSPSSWDIGVTIGTKVVSATQSSATASITGTGTAALVVFAITGDVPNSSATWASTESTDTMDFVGGLAGAWASTEAKDTFHGSSAPFGHWGSTEAKDAMDFVGTVPVIGTWASTEHADTMAISGTIPVLMQLDGYATNGISEVSGDSFAPVTTGTVTLSTTAHDDVIVVAVACGGYYNTSPVSSITDAAGLTWKRRNKRRELGDWLNIETWWAHAPSPLSSDVITVNTSGGNGSVSLIAFGVSGANYTAPWDANTQAGGYVDNTGNIEYFPAQAQLSTNATESFLFGIHGDGQADYGLVQSPWTYVTSASAEEHNGYESFESFAYQIVDAPQTATNVPFAGTYAGGPAYNAGSVMFDSIVAFGETGTTDEIYWFWDPASANGTIALTTTNDLVLNYSPVNTNLMVLVQVLIQSASGTGEVTSITEGAGALSSPGFQRRSRVVHGNLAQEIWWGWMPTERPSNDTITINTSGTTSGDGITAQMWGLGGTTGSYGLGDPFWDGNVSLPAENSSGADSPPPNATDITTETPSCMAVAWTANITEPETGYTDPFITLVQNTPNTVAPIMSFQSAGPNSYLGFEFMYAGNHNLLADETAEFVSSPEPSGWLMVADAIPVGPPQPPNGTWASVETKDKFTHTGDYSEIGIDGIGGWVGFLPIPGIWASTDHADDFTGAPEQAPYLGEGWLGWVPAFCTWASTEHADVSDLYGWLIGFGGITGQLHAGEAKDRLAFSNYSTFTGTWGSVETPDRMAAAAILIPLRTTRPPAPIKRRLLIVT